MVKHYYKSFFRVAGAAKSPITLVDKLLHQHFYALLAYAHDGRVALLQGSGDVGRCAGGFYP